ncbi:putative membrane protein [Helicobacter pylori CCHI 33]|nr:putative membrane protein [Helicobacter pylori CCHI 33]
MGVFGSVILNFLKWAFLLCFVILKLILKFYCKTHFLRG